MARKTIYVREGDLEPLQLTISGYKIASGVRAALANLDDLDTAVLYMKKRGDDQNHVDGASLTVGAAALSLIFDPASNGPSGANAFGAGSAGTYDGYILCTWTDGQTTRHPGKDDSGGYPDLHVVVTSNLES